MPCSAACACGWGGAHLDLGAAVAVGARVGHAHDAVRAPTGQAHVQQGLPVHERNAVPVPQAELPAASARMRLSRSPDWSHIKATSRPTHAGVGRPPGEVLVEAV